MATATRAIPDTTRAGRTAMSPESERAEADDESRATRRNEIIFTIAMLAILALIALVIMAVMNSSMSAPPELGGGTTP